jgi:hypothetical protein
MNTSKIFLFSEILELKLELFNKKILKTKGHLKFLLTKKPAPKSKIQPSWNPFYGSCLNFSKQICFKLVSKWFLQVVIDFKFQR